MALRDAPPNWRVASSEHAVAAFRAWFTERLAKDPDLAVQLDEIRGKPLLCWCTPAPCHGEVLLELANGRRTAYAGIGSRQTPATILETMQRIARHLADRGLVLRSGAAQGADSAFEQGCVEQKGDREIWLPWEGFNGRPFTRRLPTRAAFDLAAQFHPTWETLTDPTKRLHARNSHQILGQHLDHPVAFVVCWTPGGSGGGGTGQALRLARDRGIPVFDLGGPGRLDAFREYVRVEGWKATPSPLPFTSPPPDHLPPNPGDPANAPTSSR